MFFIAENILRDFIEQYLGPIIYPIVLTHNPDSCLNRPSWLSMFPSKLLVGGNIAADKIYNEKMAHPTSHMT